MTRIVIALLAWILLPPMAQAEKRIALVIGNTAYKFVRALPSPKNDAADMATALRAVGFEVISALDLDKLQFDSALRDFSGALSDKDISLFYFSGHGLQTNGQNYLLPVDAQPKSATSLGSEAVSLEAVYRAMSASKEQLIFLDAGRDNPLGSRGADAKQSGLAAAMFGPSSLIAFSTQPGRVVLDGGGRNSPYAASLVQRIREPGQELSSILASVRRDVVTATGAKQIPWDHSSLPPHFALASTASQQ
jgi:uncharacterized caspase-like protein